MVVSNLLMAAWIEILVCWIAWFLAFVKPNRQAKGQKPVVRAPSSRLGIGLVFVSFLLIWIWVKPVGFRKPVACLIVSMLLAPMAVLLVWISAQELGQQWRLSGQTTN